MTTPLSFLKETKEELKKVTWPTTAEAIRLTIAVLIISLIVGVFIGALDFILTKIQELLIKK